MQFKVHYLMYGVNVGVDKVQDRSKFEKEINGLAGRKFDLVIDNLHDRYAVAGWSIQDTYQTSHFPFNEVPTDFSDEVYKETREGVLSTFEGVTLDDFKVYIMTSHIDDGEPNRCCCCE